MLRTLLYACNWLMCIYYSLSKSDILLVFYMSFVYVASDNVNALITWRILRCDMLRSVWYSSTGHVRCPPLPDVEHASLFYVSGAVGDEVADTGVACRDVTDGNSCHYACRTPGYRLTGAPALTCNYSGTWLGTVPTCQSE